MRHSAETIPSHNLQRRPLSSLLSDSSSMVRGLLFHFHVYVSTISVTLYCTTASMFCVCFFIFLLTTAQFSQIMRGVCGGGGGGCTEFRFGMDPKRDKTIVLMLSVWWFAFQAMHCRCLAASPSHHLLLGTIVTIVTTLIGRTFASLVFIQVTSNIKHLSIKLFLLRSF